MAILLSCTTFGVLAQLVERMAGSHEVTGSNPVHSTREDSQVWKQTCFFYTCRSVKGFEPMRWNSVKKTCQWHVFRNSPDRACEGRVGFAKGKPGTPLSAPETSQPRNCSWVVLFYTTGDYNGVRTLPYNTPAHIVKKERAEALS